MINGVNPSLKISNIVGFETLPLVVAVSGC